MKKVLALLLAVLMLLQGFAAAESVEVPDYSEMTVGVLVKPTGCFFTSLWGSNATDVDVRNLLYAYNLMHWDADQDTYAADPSVVTGMTVTESRDGSRTYTMTLAEDLAYSDGTKITAWDYAFTVLLLSSPAMAELGVSNQTYSYFTGVTEWQNGSGTVSGVRVLNDSMIALTVDASARPFFYEMALLDVLPLPIGILAPGCSVTGGANGVGLSGPLTAELLQKTVLDAASGYMTHPSAVSGPYTMEEYDAEAGTAVFRLNPQYKGNSKGEKPSIPTIRLMTVTGESYPALLADGTITLLHKAVRSQDITAGLELTAQPEFTTANYPRSGLSLISFCTEQERVSEAAVRQAVAMCFDRTAFIAAYTGDYGYAVESYYGLGQWQYQVAMGTLTPEVDEKQLEQLEQINLDGITRYAFDTEAASALLESNGWVLNGSGIREKNGVALELTLLCNANETLVSALQTALADHLQEAGIRLTVQPVNEAQLLGAYYRNEARSCDMIFVGTNFSAMFDPSLTYSTKDADQGVNNTTGLKDEKLEQLALELRSTEAGELGTYMQRWVAFEEYWAQVLPAVPAYSNVYFDFFSSTLHNYLIGDHMTWSQAIVGAYLGDYTDAEVAEAAAE